jgi:peptide/nickel transport system permease protein
MTTIIRHTTTPRRINRRKQHEKRKGHMLRSGLRRYWGGLLAATLLVLVVLATVLAPYLTPHDPTAGMNLQARFMPPFWVQGGDIFHPFGTDNLGRDVLTRTLYGGRVSLLVAFVASSIGSGIGIIYGLISGYAGGTVDRVMMRVTDIWVSFPFIVLALAVIAVVGSTPTVLIALLSLAGWVYPARVTRAQTLKIGQTEFVAAAYAAGAPPLHIVRHHILPHIASVNIVMWTLSIGTLVLVESSLSFIGLGVSPPTPSWGNMLSDSQTYLQDAPWLSIVPGLALMLTILCVNMVGDTLQKLINPEA